jgi:hypothetical protein
VPLQSENNLFVMMMVVFGCYVIEEHAMELMNEWWIKKAV